MLQSEALELIDTYGGVLKRWPAAQREAVSELAASDKTVKKALKEARQLDSQLSKWKEDENADGGVPDFDDDGGERDEVAPEDVKPQEAREEEAEAPSPAEAAEGEPLSAEDAAAMIGALMDIPDMGKLLADIIMGLVSDEFSDEPYVEYTQDYDRIERVTPERNIDVAKVEDKVRAVSAVVQKDLQRIITARSLAVMQPGLRRGRLNPSALHRMEVEDDRVFRRKVENKSQDVAVSLLVDLSGSMNGMGKYQTAMQSAWCFADVMDRLNIKCEVLGFTTRRDLGPTAGYYGGKPFPPSYQEDVAKFAKQIGRDVSQIRTLPLYIPVLKEFGERFGIEQKKRMATVHGNAWASNHLSENIDGASVLVAAQRLLQQKAKRKLLIVFSDGNPAGGMSGSILNAHLKAVVEKIGKAGVETIGVGIMSDAVSRFYPKWFRVDNLSELPAKVIGELKRFLTT